MIAISTYKDFWEYMATVVTGIDLVYIVHEESDLASVIRDLAAGAVILFAVIPSSDIEATSNDDIEEIESCYVFIVKKSNASDLTHAEYLLQMEGTQQTMRALKNKMIELSGDTDHCQQAGTFGHLMHRLFINGMHTDPEYNLLGCNGWGLSFKLKTQGI